MRLLHTSDWHLGHTLHEQPREFEHRRFLDWLLDTIERERADALLVCGDLFDTANPPAAAQSEWYRFVALARGRFPELEMVFIAGNHDSASRVDAPAPIFDAIDTHVVGALPRGEDGELDFDRLLIPLCKGEALLVAVPFLRIADLQQVREEGVDPLVEGVRRVYGRLFAAARERLSPGQALLATGHCYMAGGSISELSERKILGGNQHALPADIFPDDLAYGALGHLHLGQAVGGRENVRYSGSPIPLALDEAGYRHHVCLVELAQGRFESVRQLEVPRVVEVMRLPAGNARPPGEVVELLEALPARPEDLPEERRPYLEVRVLLEKPDGSLRRKIEEALEGKAPRLMKLSVEYTGHGLALADATQLTHLADLSPEEVFRNRYDAQYREPVPEELLAAFHELLDALSREEAVP